MGQILQNQPSLLFHSSVPSAHTATKLGLTLAGCLPYLEVLKLVIQVPFFPFDSSKIIVLKYVYIIWQCFTFSLGLCVSLILLNYWHAFSYFFAVGSVKLSVLFLRRILLWSRFRVQEGRMLDQRREKYH